MSTTTQNDRTVRWITGHPTSSPPLTVSTPTTKARISPSTKETPAEILPMPKLVETKPPTNLANLGVPSFNDLKTLLPSKFDVLNTGVNIGINELKKLGLDFKKLGKGDQQLWTFLQELAPDAKKFPNEKSKEAYMKSKLTDLQKFYQQEAEETDKKQLTLWEQLQNKSLKAKDRSKLEHDRAILIMQREAAQDLADKFGALLKDPMSAGEQLPEIFQNLGNHLIIVQNPKIQPQGTK